MGRMTIEYKEACESVVRIIGSEEGVKKKESTHKILAKCPS